MIGYLLGLAIYIVIGYFIFKGLKKLLKKGVNGVSMTSSLFKIAQEEKVAFQQMMYTPSNETVSNYIEVAKRAMEIITKFPSSQSWDAGDQMKYINSYKVIKDTPDVSEELKDELYRMYLALGIAVSK